MPLSKGRWRRRLKHYLGLVIFRTGLYRWLYRTRAVVVAFHRVDDRYADTPLTCSARQFADFCAFFAKYFTVVPLGELVRRLVEGRSVGRLLVITFDDGYRDNREVAAAILRQRRLPACFFVATALIGSEHVPPWDADAGIPTRWMRWDDVRSLVTDGFDVGSHTAHHVDLGTVRETQARREITESKRRLEAELGKPITLFSYPYGGPTHLDEANRQVVQQAGYECCLSAFGGLVSQGTDPFRMRRTPVSPWHLSPYQFGFEAVLAGPRGDHARG